MRPYAGNQAVLTRVLRSSNMAQGLGRGPKRSAWPAPKDRAGRHPPLVHLQNRFWVMEFSAAYESAEGSREVSCPCS